MFAAVDVSTYRVRAVAAARGLAQLEPVDTRAASLAHRSSRPPRRTGRLASSVSVRAGTISSTLPYAAPVHWGWRRGTARVAGSFWVLSAVTSQHDRIVDEYVTHVRRQLDRLD